MIQAIILIGEENKAQKYLDEFYGKEGIKDVYKYIYDEFKIGDARNITKTISLKLHRDEKRVVVIKKATTESQHALLKTIEELPFGTFIFFIAKSRDEYLPTIASRSLVHLLDSGENVVNEDIKGILSNEAQIRQNPAFPFIISEKYTSEKAFFEEMTVALRSLLLDNVDDSEKKILYYSLLKKIFSVKSLVDNNNLNLKLAIEKSFLFESI